VPGDAEDADQASEDASSQDFMLTARQALDVVAQVIDYAIIALDPEGIIESWNLGAERVKGYTASEALGRRFAMFYDEADQRDGLPMRLLLEATARGRVEHTGWRIRKDGTRFWADVVITAVYNRAGRLTGFTKVTRDRSDVKALEDAQDAFYAAFTHDFRTPFAALLGHVGALRDAEEGDRDSLIERAEANVQRLLTMVEGLITFAQQRAGRATMLTAEIDVADVARRVVRDLSPALRPQRVCVATDVVALARANGTAMHRVITNLVINALKYSSEDTEVDIVFTDLRADGVEIAVVDRGRGIDPADLGTIFDEFQRGRLAQDDGGTGLGLASVRELVRQQGGSTRIESELGVGTSVTVHLEAMPPRLDAGVDDGVNDGVT
jgi:PAS domain S-box-containing protein